jgi:hypothetical protein
MTPWAGVDVTQPYEAVRVVLFVGLFVYIRTCLESLRLQVESPVLGTSIHIVLVYLVG